MRDTFVGTLTVLAEQNRDICLLTADLGFGVLDPFRKSCPEQFFNVGIAEQNMLSMAAGLALWGKTVVVYSIGNFPTLRCLEQIRNDCAGHNANVKIVCVGGGFTYGSLGMSHHATEDLAVMGAIPDMTMFSPADAFETEAAVKAMLETPGTCYLRLGRGGEKPVHAENPDFQIGKAIPVREGREAAILFTGPQWADISEALNLLKEWNIEPAVFSFPTVKPLDEGMIRAAANNFRLIVTVEEHSIRGGFGSAVAEILAETGGARLLRLGVPDCFCPVAGDQAFLRRRYGLDGESIAHRIREAL